MKRRNFTPKSKVSILKEHLVDGVTVSEVCEKHGLNVNQFYRWQKEFFENGAAAFEKKRVGGQDRAARERAEMKRKLAKKDSVIAELMEEYIQLKKELGAV